jgi:hypothetical protein
MELLTVDNIPDFIKGIVAGLLVAFLFRKLKRVFRAL